METKLEKKFDSKGGFSLRCVKMDPFIFFVKKGRMLLLRRYGKLSTAIMVRSLGSDVSC